MVLMVPVMMVSVVRGCEAPLCKLFDSWHSEGNIFRRVDPTPDKVPKVRNII